MVFISTFLLEEVYPIKSEMFLYQQHLLCANKNKLYNWKGFTKLKTNRINELCCQSSIVYDGIALVVTHTKPIHIPLKHINTHSIVRPNTISTIK